LTNPDKLNGTLSDALKGSDVFIGLSVAKALMPEMVRSMDKPIIFALANPEPEIYPDDAARAGAIVVATGRSDFNNQINNVLGFPGIFRGALDARAKVINEEMKIAAAFDKRVAKAVSEAVKAAAVKSWAAKITTVN
jgi:malate dehydrogenase (oxaloacetate-decarboxylating)